MEVNWMRNWHRGRAIKIYLRHLVVYLIKIRHLMHIKKFISKYCIVVVWRAEKNNQNDTYLVDRQALGENRAKWYWKYHLRIVNNSIKCWNITKRLRERHLLRSCFGIFLNESCEKCLYISKIGNWFYFFPSLFNLSHTNWNFLLLLLLLLSGFLIFLFQHFFSIL